VQESINDRDRTVISRKIEALLFASDTPLSASRLASLVGIESTKLIKSEIESLDRFYREQSRSFEIVEVAGGYQITTLPEFSSIISQLFKKKRKTRLSQPALETLAIVAYKQPINRMAIEAIRGVNCDGVLATLIERELIAVTGRGDGVGRPYLYSTTRMFLEYLGLKDYSDLPKIEELERKPEIADLIPKIPGSEDEDSSEDGSQFQGEASGGKEGDIGRLNEG
jgi:segregation and condensation protein B